MFTLARLGIDGRLAKTLTTSNPVESMISIARATNRNVTRWCDGQSGLIHTRFTRCCWSSAARWNRYLFRNQTVHVPVDPCGRQ